MKKNLLFIIDNLKGGGAERILITILQHLDAKKYNVDPVVLMSIALHESARGTSDVAKLRHNVGGVTLNKKGVKGIYRFKLYNRVEDCIDQMAETLSIHNKKSNIQTVKELAKAGKYCGKNEAKGWIKGVMFYVKHLKGIET